MIPIKEVVEAEAIPMDPESEALDLTANSLRVLARRYLRRDMDGAIVETPAEMFRRVAYHVALPDREHGGNVEATTERFYRLLTEFRFMPNSPTFTGAGTPLGQLAACFVIPISDDMGKEPDGIFASLRVAALIQQTGGGNGFSFSRLRPKGDRVSTSAGVATGPVGFMRVYDMAFEVISQGGVRRGANMGVLRVDHPDIFEFVRSKEKEGELTNFNISVAITDEFMRAVEEDREFHLVNPRDGKVWRTVRARDLFDEIVRHAHHNGEPGALFIDAANRDNPVPHLYQLEATNPCVSGDTLVATPQGWRRADEIRVGDEICTVDGTGRVAAVEVNHDMPVYGVVFSDGGFVRATASHQFHALDPETGTFRPRRLDTLQPGDRVRVLRPESMAMPEPVLAVGAAAGSHAPAALPAGESTAEIVSISFDGVETVYDLYEPRTDTWITAGYVSRGCGEQWLGPYENCCLGSINLARHVKRVNGRRVVDWDLLRESVETAVHFLDNVVTANRYVPAVPQLREAALRARRIGLGIMGLGDIMYDLGIRYGSAEGQEFAAQVMEFIRFHALRKSIDLARERGPFPAIKGSIYDPDDLQWQPPRPLFPFTRDWGRPELDWKEIVAELKKHGIRNAAQTTIAPTGTIATVSGCEGYGCEPVFALAYIRHFKDGDRDVELEYVSPRFLRALEEAGIDEETKRQIIEEVQRKGTCQHIAELPDHIRHTFVVAQDITAEEHVRMQATMQAFVDASISKTINFPEHATVEDVARAYFLAWRLGCKGITVYVTGTRKEVVLETRETRAKKGEGAVPEVEAHANGRDAEHALLPSGGHGGMDVRPRPPVLSGKTYRRPTPVGTAWITVNSTETGEPFEVFLNVGKAGSDVAADSEALGRLISLILRLPSPLSPTERLRRVVHQLSGIGGGRSMGFGPHRVRSLPDAIAQVLRQHLEGIEEVEPQPAQLTLPMLERELGELSGGEAHGSEYGDLCPECGLATFIPHEGCRRCTNCGYGEC